ncbi:orotidine-5'-phosphate decarboxylase [Devosia sp. ZB163]|uniref:orotidine-5'-phosphate decarboxylase n=1 Tax=Devosia sp. ZB163 TaxID=3025938 RepID=UPI00236166D2|nr:orotidine-5'-phosphate decarboxylase [Devosia sp. ZB163]MDC9822604.1 orotidine-5'-phosphate decarboxylase [Devosia sp. ZB163]
MAGTLIVALDLDTRDEAERLVADLGDAVDFYKIGYQLFYGGDGLNLGKALLAAGKRVFFDLKMLDIDNTVEKGVGAIARTGATMVTVHAYPKTMRAAAKAAAGSGLTVLGVTVLTSMDDADLIEAGYARDAAGLVALRAEQARAAGIGGIVCSPNEAQMVRAIVGPQLDIVTPGIRPSGSALGDQKRVMGPAEALAAGASHLVVGRPITAAANPRASAQAILAEMAGGTRLA